MIDWQRRCESLQQELQSLVHAVSHDLRAPLRAADGFSRVLLTKHAAELQPQAVDYLQRIRAATALMGTHIDALTRLARVTTTQLRRQRVDLSALARSVIDELRDARPESEPERQVELRLADGLEVEGDLNLLRTLMQNLLGNAWKFTSKHPGATIEFGRQQTEAEMVHFVRDTGAGFDMAYSSHLFEPFGRLHPEGDYPGTGIGLAIARRIIHRHGGRLWAEGSPGKGATFWFTIGELEKD